MSDLSEVSAFCAHRMAGCKRCSSNNCNDYDFSIVSFESNFNNTASSENNDAIIIEIDDDDSNSNESDMDETVDNNETVPNHETILNETEPNNEVSSNNAIRTGESASSKSLAAIIFLLYVFTYASNRQFQSYYLQ